MKLREFNFNSIPISWADREIKETRYYFDIFVIELKKVAS